MTWKRERYEDAGGNLKWRWKWVRGKKKEGTRFMSTVLEGAILTHAQASSDAMEAAEERREGIAIGSVESK